MYYTWYEMYPADSVEVGTGVQAGDAITASVVRSGTSYTLQVTDSTTSGNNINQHGDVRADDLPGRERRVDRRAAVVLDRDHAAGPVQDPGQRHGIRRVRWQQERQPAHDRAEEELSMLDSTQSYLLATPTSLTDSNTAFTVHWHNSF